MAAPSCSIDSLNELRIQSGVTRPMPQFLAITSGGFAGDRRRRLLLIGLPLVCGAAVVARAWRHPAAVA